MSKLILSLDGGGIRGAATTQFLSHVEAELFKQAQKTLRDCVDFYAGTSTGSIIALALATTRLSMADINQLYSVENAKHIFSENRGWFEIDGVNAPKYSAKGKRAVLETNFADARLQDVEPAHGQLLSADVADASSAAPTFFPTKAMRLEDNEFDSWLIDGGVIANNPTMCAIAEARRCWRDSDLNDFRVISVGTGFRTRKLNGPESQHWGALQWMTKGNIIDILSDEMVVGYQAITMVANGKYIRVNSQLTHQPGLPNPADDAMDDVSAGNIAKLKQMGDFWYARYGQAVVEMLLDQYTGKSLDRIDVKTGLPIVFA